MRDSILALPRRVARERLTSFTQLRCFERESRGGGGRDDREAVHARGPSGIAQVSRCELARPTDHTPDHS